jgi:hypothetical protein
MTRRSVLCGLLLSSALLASIVGWGAWRAIAKPGPVRAYERLRLGMTLSEVEQVIGAPPGEYDDATLIRSSMTFIYTLRESGISDQIAYKSVANGRGGLELQHWTWDDYCIEVALDDKGTVVGYYLLERPEPLFRPSFLGRVRAFIGL